MNYKEIVKPTGINPNLHKLDLFFPYNMLAVRNGKQYDFSVEVKDLQSRPDCKIGDFCNNVWFRPKQAQSTNWNGYKSYADLSRAVKLTLRSRGFIILGWYKRS